MSIESAEATALFRYRLIAEATSPRLSPAERGRLVRELARQLHEHTDGSQREYSRGTLDRWLRAYREQGLDGLKPEPRSDLGEVRRYPELLNEACALRAELPTRSSVQIAAILFARHRIRVAERTISQHLRQRGLHRAALARVRPLRGVPTQRAVDRRRAGGSVRAAPTRERKSPRIPFCAGRRLLANATARPLGT